MLIIMARLTSTFKTGKTSISPAGKSSHGEMLKLLCSEALSAELDGILRQNLMPRQAGGVIENDATDAQGDPVLFAYLLDLPRILRFDRALELQDRQGTVICFDFQAEVLRQFCCKNISFEVINLQKYERGILHQA